MILRIQNSEMVMADMDGEFTFSSGCMKTDSLSLSEKSIPLMDKECQLSHHSGSRILERSKVRWVRVDLFRLLVCRDNSGKVKC